MVALSMFQIAKASGQSFENITVRQILQLVDVFVSQPIFIKRIKQLVRRCTAVRAIIVGKFGPLVELRTNIA